MANVCRELEPNGFALCSCCYLVNLQHVRSVQHNQVKVNETELQISAPRKNAFLEALNSYIGG